MCGSLSSWGRWCTCDVCDFGEEMLVDHCRMWEVVLTVGVKRSQSDWWSLKGRRSRWRQKPC